MYDDATLQALARIEKEYDALPGLKLTASQVHRLCNLPQAACESALQSLTRSGFLQQMGDGAFLRLPRRFHRAIIA